MSDLELLKEYAATGRQEAFAEVAQRHAQWVYAAALRQVRDRHLADDVTQAVFIALARNAGKLRGGMVVSAWLFGVVRYASRSALRALRRRERHEKEAVMYRQTIEESQPSWEQVEPVLDELVMRLGREDQRAVLLRFYERKSLAEVGAAMGTSEEAARKRVTRAIEKLRGLFAKRGVSASAEGLGAVLLGHAAGQMIGGLEQSASAAALAAVSGQAAGHAVLIWKGAATMMVMAKVKVAVVVVALVAGAVAMPVVVYKAMASQVQSPAPAGGTAQASPAAVSVARENAADLYRQAFAMLPTTGDDAQLLNEWDTIDPEQALDVLLRLQPAIQLVRRAGALDYVDWNVEYSNAGLARIMPELNSARYMAQVAALRARYLMKQLDEEAAVADLTAALAMARHVGATPLMISRLVATSIEAMGINETAALLPKFSPDVLEELSARLDSLPAMPALSQVIQGEKKLATAALKGTGVMDQDWVRFYDELARAMDLPLEQFDKRWAQVQKESQKAGPMAATLLPAMQKAKQQIDRLAVLNAMLRAAIAVQKDGPEAVKQFADPAGGGPLVYRKLPDRGFVIESRLLVADKPLSLNVGTR